MTGAVTGQKSCGVDEKVEQRPQLQPVFQDASVTVYHGDCFDILPTMPDGSVHVVVTDPPYGLNFMGCTWDRMPSDEHPRRRRIAAQKELVNGRAYGRWCQWWARECLRLLPPGGHLLAFGSTRTSHRLTIAIEEAGFEIRDSIAWLYGQGFPKSLDVGKAMVELDGRWRGWGTGLKPAFEPIIVARRPLSGTVRSAVQQFGTGALHIAACRVPAGGRPLRIARGHDTPGKATYGKHGPGGGSYAAGQTDQGRWPPNALLTHAADCETVCTVDCPVRELNAQSGILRSGANPTRRHSDVFRDCYGHFEGNSDCRSARGVDSGGAARFFPTFRWQAKARQAERPRVDGHAHPTVKPLELMRWLVRLVTPDGGLVLDPFLGSGTTAEAARLEGFRCIGIEQEAEYLPLIRARLKGARHA